MSFSKCSYLKRLASVCSVLLLAACNNGGSSSSSGVSPGSLAFTPDQTVDLRLVGGTSGEYVAILSLENSSGVSGQAVNLSIDSSVATISGNTCYLSSGSAQSRECRITISAVAAGSTTLTASASGYQNATLPVVVSASSSPNYGSVAVRDSNGKFSTGPVSMTYAPDGGVLTVEAELLGSSGITSGTTISVAVPSGVTATPASCSVKTVTPICTSRVSGLPSSGTSVITVSAATTQGSHTYNTVQINATAQAPSPSTKNGTIVIQSQHSASSGIPNGMKAPIFLSLQDLGRNDTLTINLSITGWSTASPLSLYQFNQGYNNNMYIYGATSTAGQTQSGSPGGDPISSCVFTITGNNVSTPGGTGCAYGLASLANNGSVTVSATYSSAQGYTYDISPFTATAITNFVGDAIRTVTFTNNASDTIWIAPTSGAANAYTSPTTLAGTPTVGQNGQIQKTASSYCGPQGASYADNACPMGSTCVQGGASLNGDTASKAVPFYCYWDAPKPVAANSSSGADINTLAANYELANGAKADVYISKHSLAPAASTGTTSYASMIWSGNFFARQGCDANGNCSNGTCGSGVSGAGLACSPGAGAAPGVNTLAETTFQTSPLNTDYYDISIINGINFQAQFTPTTTSGLNLDPTNAFICGSAGSTSVQTATTYSLKAATWAMRPTTLSFPQYGTIPSTLQASSNYRIITNPLSSPSSCSDDTSCTGGTVCGWSGFPSITQGTATYAKQCGTHLTWITANSLWGQNSTITGTTPNTLAQFGFNVSAPSSGWSAPPTNPSVGNYQLCTGASIFPSDQAVGDVNPLLACGSGNWWSGNQSLITGGTLSGGWVYTSIAGQNNATYAQIPAYSSTNWQNWVLPTLSWLKTACPTCYTFPYDDHSSTFQCSVNSSTTNLNYGVTFSNTN